MKNYDIILSEVLVLPRGYRAMLAERLLVSLNLLDEKEIQKAWELTAEKFVQRIEEEKAEYSC
jgi:hypothetical protein